MFRVAILAISDAVARGEPDALHLAIRKALSGGPFEIAAYEIVPDEAAQIRRALRIWADRDGFDLVLTWGGTGVSPKDHTMEATRGLLDRELPGVVELMRFSVMRHNRLAALTRATAGIRAQSFIVNLSEDYQEALMNLEALLPILPATLERISGKSIKR